MHVTFVISVVSSVLTFFCDHDSFFCDHDSECAVMLVGVGVK